MAIELTAPALRQILPRAPQDIVDAFASPEGQRVLGIAGITETRTRLSIALSQVEHECAGFTIKNLTENTNYRAEGAAKIWPKRFPPVRNGVGDPDTVRSKYGTAPGWQLRMFDDVYGGRMGNRPGTSDGSAFIGHGGPQWTGRDGHAALARILKTLIPGLGDITAEKAIEYAIDHSMQPAVLAAFWIWKNLNPVADAGGLRAVTKPWNGGYIGMADREAALAGNNPIIAKLANVNRVMAEAKQMPGAPSTPTPPKEVVDATTTNERATRKSGGAAAGAAGATEVAKATTDAAPTKTITEQPSSVAHMVPLPVTVAVAGVGIVIMVVATVMITRKVKAVHANWF